MAEANKDAYMMELTVRNRKFKVDVRTYGKGLNMGQMSQVERIYGVTTAELQELDGDFSAQKISAWIYGMSMTKMPDVTPEDVASIDYEQVIAWFEEIGRKISEAVARGEEEPDDEDPSQGQETGSSATIPSDSGDPGWDSTSASPSEISSS